MKLSTVGLTAILLSTVSAVAPAQTADEAGGQREEIVVIGTTPLPGSNIDRDKIPGTAQVLSSDDFAKNHAIEGIGMSPSRMAEVVAPPHIQPY